MSSTYRFLCLSHEPALVVESWETQNKDEAVGLAERRGTAQQRPESRGERRRRLGLRWWQKEQP